MNAILFFVKAGIASKADKEEALAIFSKTGIHTVYRNSTVANSSGENPEPCVGVAGDVADRYKEGATFYFVDKNGDVKSVEGNQPKQEINSIGLPMGAPDNEDDLKQALKELNIEFHGRSKVKKLVSIYKAEVLGE